MGDLLLGIDLGAGSLKATLIDRDGGVVGEAANSIETSSPRFGWAEQNPHDWWAALCTAVPVALRAAGVRGEAVAAIAFSGGAHIGVLTDGSGQVLRPALLWSDSRAADEAAELRARADERIIELSLNRANPTWLLPQLLWITRHDPAVAAATRQLYMAKDWLRAQLTGSFETDYSDVVGALMADSGTGGWSTELCQMVGWDMATLPPIVASTDVVGTVTTSAAASTGLAAGTPVVCGSNDTTVELFGAGALAPGDGAVKLATAGVTYQVADGPLVRPPVSCYPHILPGLYYTATGINSCASAHRWLRDQFFAAEGFDGMDALASAVSPGSDGLQFHPYLNGERAPHWDPRLRASFTGLTMQHGRGHFARALYEGIAFAICDALTVAEGLGMRYETIRLIGGGARSATWRQIMADVLGRTILLPRNGDASFGAAIIAGLGIGIFADARTAVEQCNTVVAAHEPDPLAAERMRELFDVYRSTTQALIATNHELTRITQGV